jgi:hypothetical protein
MGLQSSSLTQVAPRPTNAYYGIVPPCRLSYTLPEGAESACLRLRYMMYGQDMGLLQVKQMSDTKAKVVWSEGFYSLRRWQEMNVKLYASQGTKVICGVETRGRK